MPDHRGRVSRSLPTLGLGLLAVFAYQFAFHIYVLRIIEPGSRNDGLSELTIFAGGPFAVVWAVALTLYAEHVFAGHVPGRVVLGAALYTLALVVVFVVYGTLRQGTDEMGFWLEAVTTYTIPAIILSPLMMSLQVGQAWWEILPYVAAGIPSVGPMLLLLWWMRPRTASTSSAA